MPTEPLAARSPPCASGTIYTYQSGSVLDRGNVGYSLHGIAYGNGTFVAVGAHGTIAASTNTAKGNSNNEGTSWTVGSSGTTQDLSIVAYGNGTFVAMGTDLVLTSPDGITWTNQTFDIPASCTKLRFDGGKFVAVGKDGVMLTSPDGIAWTTVIPATPGPIGTPVTNGSVIVATESIQGAVLTSPDGVRWTARYLPNKEHLGILTYGKGLFVGIGKDDADSRVVMTSADGITWARHDLGFSDWVMDIAFGNNAFVIVTGGSTIYTSTDAATWIPGSLSDRPASVTFKDGNFLAVGSHTVYSSPDGFNWSGYAANLQLSPSQILGGSVTSAIIDDLGGLFTSSGYKNWRQRTSPFSFGYYFVGFGNNTFMAAGNGGLLTSNDGKTWVNRILTPPFVPYGAVLFNDTFIITGENPYATTTTDNTGGMIFQTATMAPVAPPAAVPEIDFYPKSFYYGYVKRGESVTKAFSIINSWTAPLSATVQLTGANTGDFPITGGTCGQQNTLAPDESCTIEVTFKPTTAFTRNAEIVVTSNDPVTTVVTIPLTGVGVQPIITPPSPLPVAFSTVVFPAGPGGFVTVKNDGNGNLQITSAILTGSSEFSVLSDDCTGATLEPNSWCSVLIWCSRPLSSGIKTGKVTVTSNDPDHPVLEIPFIGNVLQDLNQIRITGPTPTYFISLQTACDGAAVGATIEVEGIEFLESITVSKPLTLKGGFDSGYAGSSGFTSVHGLNITGGSLTVENLVIM